MIFDLKRIWPPFEAFVSIKLKFVHIKHNRTVINLLKKHLLYKGFVSYLDYLKLDIMLNQFCPKPAFLDLRQMFGLKSDIIILPYQIILR